MNPLCLFSVHFKLNFPKNGNALSTRNALLPFWKLKFLKFSIFEYCNKMNYEIPYLPHAAYPLQLPQTF